MYVTFSFDTSYYHFFKDYKHVVETIRNNLNTTIEIINGKEPFTFIQEFLGLNIEANMLDMFQILKYLIKIV